MAIGDYDPNDPLGAAQGIQKRKLPGTASFLPAANQIGSRNTAFATGAPVNTIAQNLPDPGNYKSGSMGNNIGGALGQSFQNPYASLFNQPSQQPQQPTLTGYHWYSGTGGVSGGNNANARYNWSDGTITREPAGSQAAFPRLGLTRADQPAIGSVPQSYPQAPKEYPVTPEGNINFNVPGGSMQDALSKLYPSNSTPGSSTMIAGPARTMAQPAIAASPTGWQNQGVGQQWMGKNNGQTWLGGGNWY